MAFVEWSFVKKQPYSPVQTQRFELELQSNTLEEGMNPLFPPAIDWIVQLLYFYKDGFGISQSTTPYKKNETKTRKQTKPNRFDELYLEILSLDTKIIIIS